uniref:BRI3 binding protein n=1 Tax=Anser cygnoides TaxID=8845 RepID=A0A8B9DRF0_ANSCY
MLAQGPIMTDSPRRVPLPSGIRLGCGCPNGSSTDPQQLGLNFTILHTHVFPWHFWRRAITLQNFFSRLTERFVNGVDILMDTFWRIWTDLLDVLGIDASNLTHYFSPAAIANNPTRALLLIGAILLAYWFLSLFLGFFFYLLHMLFGRFFWIARVALFTLSCVYILQKYEGDPEHAVLPLCFVVAVYFMTGPVGFYWRRNSNSSLEEKMDHLDSQIRLLNIRLSRVIENLDRGSDQ